MIQLGGCTEAMSFAWSVVEIVGDLIAARLGNGPHAAALGQVLTQLTLYVGYGDNIILHGADALITHRSQDPCVVIIEYEVHGNIVRTGASYDNRFISVVTIEHRKIVHWRDYMDSLAAMTALSASA
jgi:limonene-1,2-epoxide hydrolase